MNPGDIYYARRNIRARNFNRQVAAARVEQRQLARGRALRRARQYWTGRFLRDQTNIPGGVARHILDYI